MLALAGYPLGIDCTFLDQSADARRGRRSRRCWSARSRTPRCSRELAVDERRAHLRLGEHLGRGARTAREAARAIRPPRAALEVSQDRLHEKALFERLKIPVAAHGAWTRARISLRAAEKLGTPGMLKTRRMGYDGKGQCVHTRARGRRRRMGAPGRAPPHLREIPALLARGVAGHRRASLARAMSSTIRCRQLPRRRHPALQPRAVRESRGSSAPPGATSSGCSSALDYVGVLTIEFFVVGGRLIANEMAPRVHNSGPLDHRGLRHQPVREPPARHLRAAARQHPPLGSHRHDQFHRDACRSRERLLDDRRVCTCTIMASSRDRAANSAIAPY